MKQKIIVVLGPTSSGKSALAVKLAKKFKGEIISADSRQIYKGLDIGSGKVTKKEMANIPHYLLSIANPKRKFSAGQYQKLALKTVRKILAKNKLAIVCGGSGFYIQALVDGIVFPKVKPNWKLRKELEKKETKALFKQLKKLDLKRAKNIDRNNRHRLIRAIEIVIASEKPVPETKKQPLPYQTLFLGINPKKEILEKLIEKRVLKQFRQGLISETKKLRQQGLSLKRLKEFGLEYRYAAYFLENKMPLEQIKKELIKEVKNYAKRQLTWFKKDKRIIWVKNYQEAEKLAQKFLSN